MGRNGEGIGVILLLLLAGSVLGGPAAGQAGGPAGGSAGNVPPGRPGSSYPGGSSAGRPGSRLPIGSPDLGSLAREFHRMVGVMEKVDSLGQMAVNPPQLPEPSQLINTSALPDMSAIIDVMGPFLSNLSGEKK